MYNSCQTVYSSQEHVVEGIYTIPIPVRLSQGLDIVGSENTSPTYCVCATMLKMQHLYHRNFLKSYVVSSPHPFIYLSIVGIYKVSMQVYTGLYYRQGSIYAHVTYLVLSVLCRSPPCVLSENISSSQHIIQRLPIYSSCRCVRSHSNRSTTPLAHCRQLTIPPPSSAPRYISIRHHCSP